MILGRFLQQWTRKITVFYQEETLSKETSKINLHRVENSARQAIHQQQSDLW